MKHPEAFLIGKNQELPPSLYNAYKEALTPPKKGTILQQIFSENDASTEKNRSVTAEVIAFYFNRTNPVWILGIPQSGKPIAERTLQHFPGAKLLRTMKLSESRSYYEQLDGWHHPILFQVPSFSTKELRTIAVENPGTTDSVLIIDDVYQYGNAARSVIENLLSKKIPIAAFAVQWETRPGSIQAIAQKYSIPSVAVFNR